MAKLFINKDIAADADKMKYWLTGEDSMSFTDIQYFLDWMPSDDNRVDIEIHSCGGDCTEGYAIYDALRASGKEISCRVVGKCASMATVILLAAPLERRTAYEHAELLIHEPYIPSLKGDVTLERIQEIASGLTVEKEKMLTLYVERTGKSREEIEVQMKTESWFSPEKAIELGFISSIVPAISAKANEPIINQNPKGMVKENEVTVKQSLIDRLLAKCGYAKIEDVPAIVGKVITTSTGDELNVERDEGEIQVGDSASPDGEFVLEDGRTVVVTDGVITEIRKPASDDDVSALREEISRLASENEELKKNAKSEDDMRILATVKKAGGEPWLNKVASSHYSPAGRSTQPVVKKPENKEQPVSLVQKKLEEAREKNKKRYQKK